jgi:hypothetical protein
MQLPDGHDRGAQINGARAAPPFSAALCLTSVGPSPVMSSPLPPFPCCRVSSIHLPSLVHVVFPSSHHPLVTCHVSRAPFHVSLSPEGEFIISRLPPFHLMSSAMNRPLSSFSHLVIFLVLLIRRHHIPVMRLILRAGLHACPSSYSVIPGGSARSLPYPKVLSWPGRPRSQEAVIEAVGGG